MKKVFARATYKRYLPEMMIYIAAVSYTHLTLPTNREV